MSEETLLNYARSQSTYMMKQAITDQNTTQRVILEVLKSTNQIDVIKTVLDSPLLNQEIFDRVFEKTKSIYFSDYSLITKIIGSNFFTREMYDYYIENMTNIFVIEKLIESIYADEESYIKILQSVQNKKDIVESISKGSAVTPNVLRKCLKYSVPVTAMDRFINYPFIDEELLKSIFLVCKNNIGLYSEIINKIIEHEKCGSELLKVIASELKNNTSKYIDKILSSEYCNAEVLKNIYVDSMNIFNKILNHPSVNSEVLVHLTEVNSTYNLKESDIESILNSDFADESVLLAIVKALSSTDVLSEYVEYYDHEYYNYMHNNSNYNKNARKSLRKAEKDKKPLIEKIINHKCMSENVANAIVNSFAHKQSIVDLVLNSAYVTKDLIVSTYLTQEKLNLSDNINKFFEIENLTAEDIIKALDVKVTFDLIDKAIDFSNSTHELNSKLIDIIYELIHSSSAKDKIEKLLDKDLLEEDLVKIVSNDGYISNIIKALEHDNATLKLINAALTRAENFTGDNKNKVITATEELKRRIIANIYNIEYEEDVTTMLRMNVEDRLSTMLWGPSGVGKTSRVFEIDPSATMLILKNGMLPEEVIGGKEPNGKPGEIYPPHWYVVLCRKCEEEADRMHILFIDEFTNVNDTIKNLVWEIIGSRLVNGHEEWPLPENCSIVVAGNRPEESSAVRIDATGGVMPAPLHNRIDSMIEIEFDIDEWQRWALETDPKTGNLRIHPIVYSFCVANADKVMFSNFDPEKVTEPFLSPRKWETLSRAIYSAEKRGVFNHVSDARIISIIGNNDITKAFIAHYERLPIDMKKIQMGSYKASDFETIDDKLYALGIIIANYTGDEITIESFIMECLGDEYLSIYKNMKSSRSSVLEAMTLNTRMKL